MFLRSPGTVNDRQRRRTLLIHTTFSRLPLYCILPACNCSIPCPQIGPGPGQPFPTPPSITSDVGCGFFRLHLWSCRIRVATSEAESASPPPVAPSDATRIIV